MIKPVGGVSDADDAIECNTQSASERPPTNDRLRSPLELRNLTPQNLAFPLRFMHGPRTHAF
jgi:hypothetical protein